MGMSKLMDLLAENREIIRNDAVMLLIHLTKSNANIQKIVAFENAFDKLLTIISEEVKYVHFLKKNCKYLFLFRDTQMEALSLKIVYC